MPFPLTRSGSNDTFTHVLLCVSAVMVVAVNALALMSLV